MGTFVINCLFVWAIVTVMMNVVGLLILAFAHVVDAVMNRKA